MQIGHSEYARVKRTPFLAIASMVGVWITG
jgi:hypothetical protein